MISYNYGIFIGANESTPKLGAYVPVRQAKGLLTASFRFHLAMDTLAVRLCTSSLPTRTRDFHPLERAHGAQTQKGDSPRPSPISLNTSSTVFCKSFLEKVADIFGECCISKLEKCASPWSDRCHSMEADILG